MVSIPDVVSVGEEDGMVQVCATLSAVNDTERNFAITLATSDDTGSYISTMIFNNNSVYLPSLSNGWYELRCSLL